MNIQNEQNHKLSLIILVVIIITVVILSTVSCFLNRSLERLDTNYNGTGWNKCTSGFK